ncbi:hypothetical protein MES5069_620144 [Mesorhizobium escarrei]|uniref:Uncharacterized protein n=1 Tax=Mesorhizobium escarrei TaxID=666018 RepID=A0ABM9EEY9_9HYPH|nr:hypothetical protein MES5069_620144 [Mesorhizobium escarrei]
MRKRDRRSIGGTYAGVPLSQVRHGMEVQWTINKTRIMLVVAEPTGIGLLATKAELCVEVKRNNCQRRPSGKVGASLLIGRHFL